MKPDGVFKMSYAINKIIFDYLQVSNNVILEGDVLQALSELLLQKPQYDWSSVKWHEGTLLLDNVINKKDQAEIAELEAVMDYIVSDTKKRPFKMKMPSRKHKTISIHSCNMQKDGIFLNSYQQCWVC